MLYIYIYIYIYVYLRGRALRRGLRAPAPQCGVPRGQGGLLGRLPARQAVHGPLVREHVGLQAGVGEVHLPQDLALLVDLHGRDRRGPVDQEEAEERAIGLGDTTAQPWPLRRVHVVVVLLPGRPLLLLPLSQESRERYCYLSKNHASAKDHADRFLSPVPFDPSEPRPGPRPEPLRMQRARGAAPWV